MTMLVKAPIAEAPGRRSVLIYMALMVYLALVTVVLHLASVKGALAVQDQLFRWPVIGALTVLGGISAWLMPRAGLLELWDARISARTRLLLPVVAGLGLGAANLAVNTLTGFAKLLAAAANVESIDVAFPASILFYSGGAILLESTYRLILIAPPLWLISTLLLRRRGHTAVFWVLALLVALLEPMDQMSFVAGHRDIMLISGAFTYAINVFEAYLLWRRGFLAPLAFRISFYLVWHVVGGALGL
jgi:hypothetical protein